jgi:hypothetical protein
MRIRDGKVQIRDHIPDPQHWPRLKLKVLISLASNNVMLDKVSNPETNRDLAKNSPKFVRPEKEKLFAVCT